MSTKHSGDLKSPHERLLRSSQFVHKLASELKRWELRAPQVLDRILDELYNRHDGLLIDYRGDVVDIETVDVMDLFGEDPERQIRALLRFANRPPKKNAPKRLTRRLMMTHFASEIVTGRHDGAMH